MSNEHCVQPDVAREQTSLAVVLSSTFRRNAVPAGVAQHDCEFIVGNPSIMSRWLVISEPKLASCSLGDYIVRTARNRVLPSTTL